MPPWNFLTLPWLRTTASESLLSLCHTPHGYFHSACCTGCRPMSVLHVKLYLAPNHSCQAWAWTGCNCHLFKSPWSFTNPMWYSHNLCFHWSILLPLRFHSFWFPLTIGYLFAWCLFVLFLLIRCVIYDMK